jgi:hypothetical protein
MKSFESNVQKTLQRTQLMVIDKVKDLMKRKELFAKLNDAKEEYLEIKEGAESIFYKRIAQITEEIAAHMTA